MSSSANLIETSWDKRTKAMQPSGSICVRGYLGSSRPTNQGELGEPEALSSDPVRNTAPWM